MQTQLDTLNSAVLLRIIGTKMKEEGIRHPHDVRYYPHVFLQTLVNATSIHG